MYRGFDLNIGDRIGETLCPSGKNGNHQYLGFWKKNEENTKNVKNCLDILLRKHPIDGTALQREWFPEIKADVFISHSHSDTRLAIKFASWLQKNFGLKSFIDSCVWKHVDSLIKTIDDRFCKRTDGSYDYDKKNRTNAHVYLMLTIALQQMIDKAECLFFLKTPNSLSVNDEIAHKTQSAWLHSEVTISRLIEKKIPLRLRPALTASITNMKQPVFEYNVDLNHLAKITYTHLYEWEKNYSRGNALDILYGISPCKSLPQTKK